MSPPGECGELLAEGRVLEDEISSGTHSREERRQEGSEEAEHRAEENPGPRKNRPWFQGGLSFGEGPALISFLLSPSRLGSRIRHCAAPGRRTLPCPPAEPRGVS